MSFKIIALLLLIVGLVVGLQLVFKGTIFRSRADSSPIIFTGDMIQEVDGKQVTSSAAIEVELLSPLGPPAANQVLGVSIEPSTFEQWWDSILIFLFIKQKEKDSSKDNGSHYLTLEQIQKYEKSYAPLPEPTRNEEPPLVTISPQPVQEEPPVIPDQITTAAFRIAESPTELESKEFLVYSEHPMRVQYSFVDPTPHLKTVFAQFKDNNGQLSEVFSRSIELVSGVDPVEAAPPPSDSSDQYEHSNDQSEDSTTIPLTQLYKNVTLKVGSC